MAAVSVGQISEFQSELESITVYLERLSQFFIANEIPTARRAAVPARSSWPRFLASWQDLGKMDKILPRSCQEAKKSPKINYVHFNI